MNIRKFTTTSKILLILFSIYLSSCTTLDLRKRQDFSKTTRRDLTSKQQKIVKTALKSVEMNYSEELTFKNRVFTNDCSGLIYGIFWESNIDLIRAISKERGNGVKRLFKVLDNNNLIHYNKFPNPGDLIFWNNTYGIWGGNPLSHIGIVVSVDYVSGQIEYIHNNTYIGAIKKESMNLFIPHKKKPINNYMRYDNNYKKTSGELFDSFGMAWKL